MATWQAYGRRHVHGIGLETAKGHADIDFSQALSWIVDRFAGKLVANDCR